MLRRQIAHAFVAAIEWKWTRILTSLSILVTSVAVTGCKHPH